VRVLLEAGANATIKTENNGELPLHVAAESGDEEAVRLLLDPNVNIKAARDVVDATTDKGETALHLAARGGHDEVVGILLAAHSDVNARTNDDETPLQLANREFKEGYSKTIRILSGALNPRSRRDMLLDMYGEEDPEDFAAVVEHFDWTGLDRPDVEEQGKIIKIIARKEEHTSAHDVLRRRAYKRAKTDPLPPEWEAEEMTALQLAAYLGDHLIVWWLLYDNWTKAMKGDCDRAIKIAKYCKARLSSHETSINTRAASPNASSYRLDSKDKLKVNRVADVEILNPSNEADKTFTAEKQPNTSQALEHEGRPKSDLAHSAQSAKPSSKKIDQGNEERPSKSNQERIKEYKTRALDYSETVDTLQDPPIDYSFVRGWSKTDDLKTKTDDTIRPLAEQFEATIVDFYRPKKGVNTRGDGRVDFLRRTRSVWDIIYAQQAEQKRVKPVEKEKEPKPNISGNLVDEPNVYGPGRIMEDARSEARKYRANSNIAKQRVYNEDDLQFRWLHLPANNVSERICGLRGIQTDIKVAGMDDCENCKSFIKDGNTDIPYSGLNEKDIPGQKEGAGGIQSSG
jgi:hypothetical protein